MEENIFCKYSNTKRIIVEWLTKNLSGFIVLKIIILPTFFFYLYFMHYSFFVSLMNSFPRVIVTLFVF